MAWLFRYRKYATDRALIEGMIAEDEVAPAARDIPLDELLFQYREANALDGRELREHWNYPQHLPD